MEAHLRSEAELAILRWFITRIRMALKGFILAEAVGTVGSRDKLEMYMQEWRKEMGMHGHGIEKQDLQKQALRVATSGEFNVVAVITYLSWHLSG